MNNNRASGFTLIEILVAIVVIGILAAAAMLAYQSYANRAASAQLIEQYDALREKTIIAADEAGIDLCADPQTSLVSDENLYSKHADLSIVKTDLGYAKPLGLHIKADIANEGKHNTAIAREAHNVLNRSNRIAPGAVIVDSAVSFTALLVNVPCTSVQMVTSGLSAQPVTIIPAQTAQPPQPKVMAEVMKFSGPDVYVRPDGDGRIDTDGDLTALTLDMSFIGDGSIPAASGGAGPVMFNYGDASNRHNAFSLWNPHSLSVAIGEKNYDTGLNVADGKTHRVTVSWDGTKGTLDVYDNGRLVKSFNGVAQDQTLAGNGFMVIAHKGEPGAYSSTETFNGQVFHTSFANVAVSAQQASNPLHQSLDKSSGLLTDIRVDGSSIVDRTGRQQVVSGSGVSAVVSGVEARLVN